MAVAAFVVVRIGGTNDISQSQSHSVLEWGSAHSDDLWRVQADRRLSDGVSPTPTPGPGPEPPGAVIGEPQLLAPDEPTPRPVPAPKAAPRPVLTDVEAAICSVGWPDCQKALRVARCESGPDYYAGYSVHVGTFQISPIHAWRFTALGLDYWRHGDDFYSNSAVAYWIYKDAGGWGPWPYCGFR